MTSLLCDRRPGGTIGVVDSDSVEELMIDGSDHIETLYLPKNEARCRRSKTRRPQSTPNPGQRMRLRNMDPNALIGHSLKLQAWLNEKTVQSIQDKTDTEVKNTRKLYDSVLETEETFVKDLEEMLAQKETAERRRKEILHKKWRDQVERPISQQVSREINGPSYKELASRKRELYRDYLEHVNRKGHVFLDTIAPDEYYPMSLHPSRPASSVLMAETRPLQDPLHSQERQRTEDDRIIFRCMTGSTLTDKDVAQIRLPPLPLVPLGRHGTECRTWLDMPMTDIESPVRHASRRRMRPDSNTSHFRFEAWGKQPFDPSIVDEELQIQKKRMYPQEPTFVFRGPSKQDMAIQVDLEAC